MVIFLSFGGLILLGAVLLSTPWASSYEISWIDALFTSASAVCVTGLVVVDTGGEWTLTGQTIILLLIQLGGLGILTLSAFIASILIGKVSLNLRKTLSDTVSGEFWGDLRKFLKRTIFFVFFWELLGTVGYLIVFRLEGHPGGSFFSALFHSVSAFCNAGFSLFAQSFEPFRGSFWVNVTTMVLIIVGGVGFVVMNDCYLVLRGRERQLSFHSRLVLLTSISLIVLGALFLWILEWKRGFASFSTGEKFWAGIFQSVTARTAGFSTAPLDQFSMAGLLVMMFLMWVGGSPGSTAGGIKTTSLVVLLASFRSLLKQQKTVQIWKRSLSSETVRNVIVIVLLSMVCILMAAFLLALTESNNSWLFRQPYPFLTLLFESVSAFGTVGLSVGITPHLSTAGKAIIICLMFIGRVGPLTLVLLLSRREKESYFTYPREEIMIG